MCRLFGLTAGGHRIHATFWLLDAPDSLEVESRRNADGTGLGYFTATGRPVVTKQAVAAYRDPPFIRAAIDARSTAFVGHVRWASTGVPAERNTHPFSMGGRIMAHNGSFGELAALEERLGAYRRLVVGETDSERYFALITQEIRARGGDVSAGIVAAARWIAQNLPVWSLNTVVIAPGQLWALRYPEQHSLHVLERPAVPTAGMTLRSAISSIHAPGIDAAPCVVVASEELDGEEGWRMLDAGELLHVSRRLEVTSTLALPDPPARAARPPSPNPNIDT